LKIYSERLPLKYLFSDKGICLGVDMKRCSYLFLLSKRGAMLLRRPVGDRVVEENGYDIPSILNALKK